MMSDHLQKVVIIGAGGFAREVLDTIDAVNQVSLRYEMLGYVVDAQYGELGTLVNDKPILGDLDWLIQHKDEVFVLCGIGAPEVRYQFVERAAQIGVKYFSVIHPSVIKTRWMTIGEGSVIAAGSVLSNQIVIGNHVHINPGTIIGHDASFEDFVSIAPGARISGNVTLKQGCYVGTGVNIIEKKTIHAWSIIGAGSTVIHDVRANTTVVGVPGQVIKERPEGWHRGS
jgi:sugar O-acyltransferase (sialic acid O-acetyltransferase NeuD family)